MATRAEYIISAQDATKDAIRSIESNFKSLDRGVTSAVRGMNLALGAFVGVGLKNLFRTSLQATVEAAGGNSHFAKTLDDVKKAATDLLVPKTGLPGVTENLEEMARTLKDPSVQAAADKLFSTLLRGGTAAVNILAQTTAGLNILAGGGTNAQVNTDTQIRRLSEQLKLAKAGGAAPYMVDDLQRKLDALQRSFDVMDNIATGGNFGNPLAGLDLAGGAAKSINEAAAAYEAADKAAKDYADTVAEIQKMLDKAPGDLAATASDQLNEQLKQQEETRKAADEFYNDTQEKAKQTSAAVAKMEQEAAEEAKQAAQRTHEVWTDFFLTPIQEGFAGMKRRFKATIEEMVAEMAASGIISILNGGSFISGAKSGLADFVGGLGHLFGFANGGDFAVPGVGGIDSQVVAFKATPGERVSVRRPDQNGGGGGVQNVFNIDARGADAGVDQKIRTALAQAAPMIVDASRRAVKDDLSRGAMRR